MIPNTKSIRLIENIKKKKCTVVVLRGGCKLWGNIPSLLKSGCARGVKKVRKEWGGESCGGDIMMTL